jgi:nuclear pore complex protein Nup188
LADGDVIDATTGGSADRDSVADIIGIFASLFLGVIKATAINPDSTEDLKEDALRLLDSASSGLRQNRDLVAVIFDIFEDELQRQSAGSGPDLSLEILIR